jgi:hypothetical protein
VRVGQRDRAVKPPRVGVQLDRQPHGVSHGERRAAKACPEARLERVPRGTAGRCRVVDGDRARCVLCVRRAKGAAEPARRAQQRERARA